MQEKNNWLQIKKSPARNVLFDKLIIERIYHIHNISNCDANNLETENHFTIILKAKIILISMIFGYDSYDFGLFLLLMVLGYGMSEEKSHNFVMK